MNKDKIIPWVCIIIAALFVYGKYFVADTEVQAFSYQIIAMLWVIISILYTILMKGKE